MGSPLLGEFLSLVLLAILAGAGASYARWYFTSHQRRAHTEPYLPPPIGPGQPH